MALGRNRGTSSQPGFTWILTLSSSLDEPGSHGDRPLCFVATGVVTTNTSLGLLAFCIPPPHRCSDHLLTPNPAVPASKPDEVVQRGVLQNSGPRVQRLDVCSSPCSPRRLTSRRRSRTDLNFRRKSSTRSPNRVCSNLHVEGLIKK